MPHNPHIEPARDRIATDWWPLAACCLGTFLLLVFTTIATVALPDIGADLHAGPGAQQWVVNAYTVALAGLLLGAGSIGDAFGIQRMCAIGVVGFGAATLLAALAPDVHWLIAGRAAQGVAGALMFACIPALIGAAYADPRLRSVAFAVWGAVAGASSAVGTIAGGLLTQLLGWRWLFLAALPVCALCLLLTARIRTAPAPTARRGIDWGGMALASTTVTALAYAITTAGESGVGGSQSLAAAGIAAVAGVGFVAVERHVEHPMLPLGFVASRSFLAVLLTAFAYYFAAFGPLPAIATWTQSSLGFGSLAASLLLVVQLVAFIVATATLSHRVRGAGSTWTLGVPTVIVGLAALTGAAVASGTGWTALLPFLVLSGLAAGVISPALPAVTLAATPPPFAAAATSAVNASRQLGLALGVAVCGSITITPGALPTAIGLAICASIAITAGVGAVALFRSVRVRRDSADLAGSTREP